MDSPNLSQYLNFSAVRLGVILLTPIKKTKIPQNSPNKLVLIHKIP